MIVADERNRSTNHAFGATTGVDLQVPAILAYLEATWGWCENKVPEPSIN